MVITRKNIFAKLNKTLFLSIEGATSFCRLRGNPYVELVHWINHIWQSDNNDLKYIINYFNIDNEQIERGIAEALTHLPVGASSISDFSYHIELAIERAWLYASLECFGSQIRSGHLVVALLSNMELRRAMVAMIPAVNAIDLELLTSQLNYITRESPESDEAAGDSHSICAGIVPEQASQTISSKSNASQALSQYTSDLTKLAREDKIDPILGRSHEITTLIDILMRRRQNNPLLTGDAGVGKTAVVEGLAQAIAAGNVPPVLQNVQLLTLDVIALSAGASMKGEFEARLKSVLDEAIAAPYPVILFIDEVHTLVGAGGNAGTGDAANLLKPALARGQLRTIGATTWSEFKRHIEKDPALTRRFQVLQIAEPDEERAIAMLRGLVPALEKHHGVWIIEQAVQAAVRLSHRYIPARQLPDKAIGLLDTACARVAVAQFAPPCELQRLAWQKETFLTELEQLKKAQMFGRDVTCRMAELNTALSEIENQSNVLDSCWKAEREQVEVIIGLRKQLSEITQANSSADTKEVQQLRQQLHQNEEILQQLCREQRVVPAEVDEEAIARIIGDWTQIPVGQMLKDELHKVIELPERLESRVIGQPEALKRLSESIMTARAGLADPRKPLGVFLLAGPSGVGKTETALAIAENMYGGEQNLITINMSEYQEPHTVSSLKGSPPGYVGYGEGGVLTEAVRRRPYSVVLLDEIEKAHPDVHELFYQVFDKGEMEDSEGRQINFKNTILLLTCNTGGDLITHLCTDEKTIPDQAGLVSVLQKELLKVFPAAFLGRVNIIPYLALQFSSLRYIASLHLARVKQRMLMQHKCELQYSETVLEKIVAHCSVAETGARLLIRYIEQHITPLIGKTVLLHQKIITGKQIVLEWGKNEFTAKLTKEEF